MPEFGPDIMGGGMEGGDFGGETGGESSGAGPKEQVNPFEISPEKERQFQAQAAAVKKLWIEEKKARGKDDKVANIIIKFLKDPGRTKFFIVLAKLVSQNVPSEFLLSILALIDSESQKETGLLLTAGSQNKALSGQTEQTALAPQIQTKENFKKLPPELKKDIDNWTNNIYQVGLKMPGRVLRTLITKERRIFEPFFQLGAFVLQEFLNKHQIENDFADVSDFITAVFTSILKKYKQILDKKQRENAGKKQLEEKKD